MNGKVLGGIVVLIILIAGGWYLFSRGPSSQPYQAPSVPVTTSTTTTTTTTTTTGTQNTIHYTDNGFVPALLSVSVGTQVTFVNDSSDEMWIASNPHPTHQGYDGTTKSVHCAVGYAGPTPFDECAAVMQGGSYSFTFTKIGTWGYHNHGAPANGGTVVVMP